MLCKNLFVRISNNMTRIIAFPAEFDWIFCVFIRSQFIVFPLNIIIRFFLFLKIVLADSERQSFVAFVMWTLPQIVFQTRRHIQLTIRQFNRWPVCNMICYVKTNGKKMIKFLHLHKQCCWRCHKSNWSEVYEVRRTDVEYENLQDAKKKNAWKFWKSTHT